MTSWERDSVERVARLMAALDDPSSNKAEVLARAGFDQAETWEYLRQAWLDRLVADPKSEISRAFAAAYVAAAGCEIGAVTLTPAPPTPAVDPFAETAEMTLAPVSTS